MGTERIPPSPLTTTIPEIATTTVTASSIISTTKEIAKNTITTANALSSHTAPRIQEQHTVKPQTTSWLQRFVARCVLPALSHPKNQTDIVTAKKDPILPSGLEQSFIDKMQYKETTISLPDETVIARNTKHSKKLSHILGQQISKNKSIETKYKCHTLTFEGVSKPTAFKMVYVKEGTQLTDKFAEMLQQVSEKGTHNLKIIELPLHLFQNSSNKSKAIDKIEEHLKQGPNEIECVDISDDEAYSVSKLPTPKFSPMQDIAIQTSDKKAILNGKIYQHDYLRPLEQLGQPITTPENQKWIIYLNPNAGSVDRSGPFLHDLAKNTGANVLSCDYRGVGKSSGFPVSEDDLINDGLSQVEYLVKARNVKPENIMVFGSSLGGAIATHVAAECAKEKQNLVLCSDRSFSSLSCAIHHIGKIFDQIAPSIARLARSVAAYIANASGWRLESAEKLKTIFHQQKKDKIAIIHHPNDQIVHIEASAHRALQNLQDSYTSITLKEESANEPTTSLQQFLDHAHNRKFNKNEWNEFVGFTRNALKIPLTVDSSSQESITPERETPPQNNKEGLESGNLLE